LENGREVVRLFPLENEYVFLYNAYKFMIGVEKHRLHAAVSAVRMNALKQPKGECL